MKQFIAFILMALPLQGFAMDLNEHKGKVVLVVNIATRCGYTGQLKGLEKIHQKYKDKGLVVLGVPSNDFGFQTPEGNDEVKKFCSTNYGVTFPLTPKLVVQGPKKDALFQWLTKTEKGEKEIAWNFEKFLVDRKGKLLARYPSQTEPEATELTSAIETALAK